MLVHGEGGISAEWLLRPSDCRDVDGVSGRPALGEGVPGLRWFKVAGARPSARSHALPTAVSASDSTKSGPIVTRPSGQARLWLRWKGRKRPSSEIAETLSRPPLQSGSRC